jgi:hypothetical protein
LVIVFKSVVHEFDCSVLVVCRLVGGEGDDGVGKSGFSEYGCFYGRRLNKKLMKLTHTQKITPLEQHTFYPRVVNNININFSINEMRLLHKGLKYNTHTKKKNWIQTLALEAETVITQLPITERDVYRKLAANRIDELQRQNPTHRIHPEAKTIHSIQRKLKDNDAMVTRADKGNSMVILPTHQYEAKLQDFLRNKDFHTITTDPTPTFQTQIRATVRQSPTLIPKEQRWKYTNMNPSAPSIKGLIKLHKPDQPIRPVVYWRNALAYRLSKLFTDKINHLTPLSSSLNLMNSQDLLKNLEATPMLPHYTLASLDIPSLYTNIPVKETRTILANILQQRLIHPNT